MSSLSCERHTRNSPLSTPPQPLLPPTALHLPPLRLATAAVGVRAWVRVGVRGMEPEKEDKRQRQRHEHTLSRNYQVRL